MKTTSNLTPITNIDLSKEILVVNPVLTPISSILLGKGTVKANNTIVQKRIKTLSETASGKRKEGASAPDAETTAYTTVTNNMEIFSKSAKVSGTVAAIEGNKKAALAKELNDRLLEIKGDMEYAFINGIKADESAGSGRAMNGLLNLVDENNIIDARNKTYNEDLILDALQAMFNTGGTFGTLYMVANPSVKRLTDKIFKDAQNVTINFIPGNTTVGLVVKAIATDFGIVNLVMSNAMPAKTVLIFNADVAEVHELRKVIYEALAKTGDAESGQVVGENTVITAPGAVAKIINIGVTGSNGDTVRIYPDSTFNYVIGDDTFVINTTGVNPTIKASATEDVDYDINVAGIAPLFPEGFATAAGFTSGETNNAVALVEIPFDNSEVFNVTDVKYNGNVLTSADVKYIDGKWYLIMVKGLKESNGVVSGGYATFTLAYADVSKTYAWTYNGLTLEV